MPIFIMPILGKLSSTDYTVFLSIVAAVPFTPTVVSFLPTFVPATVSMFLGSIRIHSAATAFAIAVAAFLVAHPLSPAPGAWWCIFYPVVCVSDGEVDSTFESTPAVYVAAAAPVVPLAPPLSSANPTATPNASINAKSTNALAAVSQHYC
jgi:hypothetical protein